MIDNGNKTKLQKDKLKWAPLNPRNTPNQSADSDEVWRTSNVTGHVTKQCIDTEDRFVGFESDGTCRDLCIFVLFQ